ncbi:MAG: hypothetical protein AB8G15_14155 [Saprospiraceae bacterium]
MIKFLFTLERKMIENFSFVDYAFLKIYGAIFGLLVGAYYPEVVKTYQWFLIGLFLLLLGRFLFLLLRKKRVR